MLNFDHHKFEKIIDKAFIDINKKGVQNLIIDVRNNGGGSDILGRYLFNYLANEPAVYFDSIYTSPGIADTTFLFEHTEKKSMV